MSTISIISTKLNDVFSELDTLFDLPESDRLYSPNVERWNIDQILEHTYLTNYYLLIIIRKGIEKTLKGLQNLPADHVTNLERMETVGVNGSFKWIRPEHMEPKGEMTNAEVRENLKAQLEQCQSLLAKLSTIEHPLYGTTMTVNSLGRLDMYEWIYFVALHAQRHIEQANNNLKEKALS